MATLTQSVGQFGVLQEAPDQETLLRRALRGDAAAFEMLYTPHGRALYQTAFRILGHPEEAEDALQEGLLAAFCHLDQFQGRSKFSTWLHSIVVNAALQNLRRRKREVAIASTDDGFDDAEPTSSVSFPDLRANPEEEYSSVERSRILEKEIRQLPAPYRTVLQLCDLQGLMEREAAERLGTAVHVIKSRRFRGRRMLFKRLRCKPV